MTDRNSIFKNTISEKAVFDKTASRQIEQLQKQLREIAPVAVAVSGGVDSMTLAVVAHRNDASTKIFHAISPAVPIAATERVKCYAEEEGWNLQLVDAREMEDDNYRRNPVNRCYYCKTNLYGTLAAEIATMDTAGARFTIVSGTNVDDLNDYRPGLNAAEEHQVVHPFVEVDIDKSGIRAIARHLDLNDLYDLPAAPCLSSRVTTGIEINAKLLPVIDEVESFLWQTYSQDLSLTGVRCRIQPEKIAIQLDGLEAIDQSADYVADIQQAVRNLLVAKGFDHYNIVNVELYQRGSAFVRDGVQIIESQNL